MGKAIEAAVAAAKAEDADGMHEAVDRLSKMDAAQTGKVMGGVLRLLLEQKHPDGLDSEDIRDLLTRCTLAATAWLPETDPHTLLVILAGALGIHPDEHEQVTRPSPADIAFNAPLLIAHLLTGKLEPLVTATFADIQRAELMDDL